MPENEKNQNETTPNQEPVTGENDTYPAPEGERLPGVPTPPAPSSPSVPNRPQPTTEADLDAVKILEEVTLPERRTFRGQADAPVPQEPEKEESKETSAPPLQETLEEKMRQVAAEVSQNPTKQAEDNSIIRSVRTFRDDLEGLVRNRKVSLVRSAALEAKKKGQQAKQQTPAESPNPVRAKKRRRAFFFVLLSIILVILGAGALAFIAFISSEHSTSSSLPESSLMFAEQTVGFPIEDRVPRELKRDLDRVRAHVNGTLGSITRIVLLAQEFDPATNAAVERPLSATEFFYALDTGAPDTFVRAIGDDFFFGIHTIDENAPVLVVPVTSYERAFAGMLEWERTMNEGLTPLFTTVPYETLLSDGTLIERKFEDLIIRNYDVRALRDQSGEVQLLYAFPNRSLLIIAENPVSFVESLSRLQAERRL